MRPISARAHLTGIGLTSQNRAWMSSRFLSWVARAAAMSPARHHDVVVAGEHAEVVGEVLGGHRGVLDRARGLLEAPRVGVGGQAREVPLADGAAGAAGDVVEDAGHVHLVEDGGEVAVDALLVGLVVVRRDEQQAVHALLDEAGGLALGLEGGVGARAADDGDAAGHALHDAARDGEVLLVGHRGGLAGGAEHEDAVGAVIKMEIDEALEGLKVDGAVLAKRRDERDDRSGQVGHVHGVAFLDLIQMGTDPF